MLPFKPTSKFLVLVLVRLFLSLALVWYLFCLLVPNGAGTVVRDVSFPAGSGIRKLAAELKSGGIIRSQWHFILVSRLRGQAHRLKAGDYRFNDGMNTARILGKVTAGEVDFRRFVLPEGYSIYQAAELLDQQGLFKKELFLGKCRDSSLLTRLGVPAASVEGYLFPATYNLPLSGSEEQLISQMVAHFNRTVDSLRLASQSAGLTLHNLVTLASLIEKEAVSPAEKPLISSVFHNRLRIGMPLQSDPTAVYGVRAFTGKVTKQDISRPSAYNTYLNRGLPPGPIGNPGVEALEAALHPAVTPYLYFVARKDGTHQFSRTLQEHNNAVNRYLKR